MAFDASTMFGNDNQNTLVNTHRANGIQNPKAVNDFNTTAGDTYGLAETSTNIFIYSNGGLVGMIQSFSVSESRNINKLQAIGYEGVVQAVPSNTNGGQLSVTRIALYESNLFRALGATSNGHNGSPIGSKIHTTGVTDVTYNDNDGPKPNATDGSFAFRTLRDQRVPFEIVVKTRMDGSTEQYYEEKYVDCWLASYSKAYTVSQITVAENATISYGDVY
ncbi:hypothetical protein D3C81_415000 [compost metagenome]